LCADGDRSGWARPRNPPDEAYGTVSLKGL
jgi:hypothetical protein